MTDDFVNFLEPAFVVEGHSPEPLLAIERAARTCYRSEGKVCEGSAARLVAMLIERGHDAMLEHAWVSARITCDRGVSHELVRHRVASFAQESTRYCDYGRAGRVAIILPEEGTFATIEQVDLWEAAVRAAAKAYLDARALGLSPQIARDLLPHCVATQIVVTANVREWRHIFTLRTSKQAHPRMRQVMRLGLCELRARWPELFNDVGELYDGCDAKSG